MRNTCPKFNYLDFTIAACAKYPACDGCSKLFLCENCQNQSALVDKTVVSCDMIDLQDVCRVCPKRNMPDFSPEETCTHCRAKNKARS